MNPNIAIELLAAIKFSGIDPKSGVLSGSAVLLALLEKTPNIKCAAFTLSSAGEVYVQCP
jgi:hypothetical protein